MYKTNRTKTSGKIGDSRIYTQKVCRNINMRHSVLTASAFILAITGAYLFIFLSLFRLNISIYKTEISTSETSATDSPASPQINAAEQFSPRLNIKEPLIYSVIYNNGFFVKIVDTSDSMHDIYSDWYAIDPRTGIISDTPEKQSPWIRIDEYNFTSGGYRIVKNNDRWALYDAAGDMSEDNKIFTLIAYERIDGVFYNKKPIGVYDGYLYFIFDMHTDDNSNSGIARVDIESGRESILYKLFYSNTGLNRSSVFFDDANGILAFHADDRRMITIETGEETVDFSKTGLYVSDLNGDIEFTKVMVGENDVLNYANNAIGYYDGRLYFVISGDADVFKWYGLNANGEFYSALVSYRLSDGKIEFICEDDRGFAFAVVEKGYYFCCFSDRYVIEDDGSITLGKRYFHCGALN